MADKVKRVDLSKGLWPTQADTFLAEGYAAECTNLVRTSKGHWALRGNFNAAYTWTASTYAAYVKTLLSSQVSFDKTYVCRAFEFSNTTDAPCMIISWTDGTDKYFKMLNAYPTGGNNGWGEGKLNAHKEWSAMCQYKDRIYGCDNVHPVAKLTAFGNFNGTVGTVTSTDMGLPVANNSDKIGCLVTLNDRMFASAGNRIWFTEVAATGGYPENWNSGNNFIDVVVDRGTSIIARMIPMNDRLYIFTDKGIYVLNCKGSASTWVLQLVTSDVSVFTYNSVARIGKVFILNDRNNMYTFNGASVIPILPQLEEIFMKNTLCEIFPFEDGVILQFCTGGGGGTAVPTFGTASFYYFDGVALSLFTLPGNFSSQGISGGFTKKYTPMDFGQPRSYLVCREAAYVYKPNSFDNDFSTTSRQSFDFALATPYKSEAPYVIKRIKEAFVEAYVDKYIADHQGLITVEGTTTSPIDMNGLGESGSATVWEQKFGIASPTRKFKLRMYGTYNADSYLLNQIGIGVPRWLPPIEYRDIYFVYEEMENFPIGSGYKV